MKLEFVYNVSTVRLNCEVFSVGDFQKIAPEFKPPKSLSNIHYVPSKRHTRIENGISKNHPIIWDEGDYYISRYNDLKIYIAHKKATTPKVDNSEELVSRVVVEIILETDKNKIDPNHSYDINRKKEYPEIEELVVALWEHIVEGRNLKDSEIETLENIRSAVKSRYHKK